MNDISAKASGFVHDLGEAARQNPLSAALIGMGVLWLFTNGRNAERFGDVARRSGLERIPDVAVDAVDAARSSLRSGAEAIGSRAASVGDTVREGSAEFISGAGRYGREYAETAADYARTIPGSGVELFDTVRSNLTDVFKAQPMALGAIGLAIGAGIAAALPSTEVEATYLGESSDALKTKATDFASEQANRATKVAGAVLDTVSEEARRQGLTLEEAKSAAGDISAKVGRVVDAASKGVSGKAPAKTPT